MENFSKNELLARVMSLNSIIECINTKNCYDEVVKFFQITSELHDHSEEIWNLLPSLKGIKFCGWRSAERELSEDNRSVAEIGLRQFLHEIQEAGRDPFGHNRTEPGQEVTKDNVFFGNVWGIGTFPIKTFESDCKDDAFIQTHIRYQITRFVQSYKDSFDANWLRYWIP